MTELTLKGVHNEVEELKKEVKKMKVLVEEDFELSENAKKELAESRNEDVSTYVDEEEVTKEFS
ncbi:MAG: hypothetical protein QF486_01475 [Candidatus Woesearchaeota archaeon]|jgi:hypothetical protein|nr:hypothetical protein [Candidatus Woesearchaeota archaeon]MDP7198264.1 hypothetical protein [Candidatus Woesearchaeota archaeon]MDP7467100.1 hypothetical protein [Candidatus Woesearchaeota archaeon]MDP7646769.1 hypothetical protein [Candidatus Woesearchaeota archaeon]|tara:strand:+ start:774 stop:965 length:192 start_codon:yes stop_codon:yes gene_type:complete